MSKKMDKFINCVQSTINGYASYRGRYHFYKFLRILLMKFRTVCLASSISTSRLPFLEDKVNDKKASDIGSRFDSHFLLVATCSNGGVFL